MTAQVEATWKPDRSLSPYWHKLLHSERILLQQFDENNLIWAIQGFCSSGAHWKYSGDNEYFDPDFEQPTALIGTNGADHGHPLVTDWRDQLTLTKKKQIFSNNFRKRKLFRYEKFDITLASFELMKTQLTSFELRQTSCHYEYESVINTLLLQLHLVQPRRWNRHFTI